jgi:DNA-binding ferritin-like protein (Dps family)
MSDKHKRGPVGRLRDRVLGSRAGKREWREYKGRVAALPPDYRLVMEKIQKFLWTAGGAVDEQSFRVLYDICEVLEESAAAGRPVLEATGGDVAAFSLNMLAATEGKTWHGLKADQLNAEVHRLLGGHDGR